MGFNYPPNLLVFKPGLNLNGFWGKRIVAGHMSPFDSHGDGCCLSFFLDLV